MKKLPKDLLGLLFAHYFSGLDAIRALRVCKAWNRAAIERVGIKVLQKRALFDYAAGKFGTCDRSARFTGKNSLFFFMQTKTMTPMPL